MQQFLHSEQSQLFVPANKLASLIFILCFLSFSLTAKDSRFHEGILGINKLQNEFSMPEVASMNYFVLEEIPGKYKILKAVVNGREIIMRPGRIEMFLNSANLEESSYLIFNGCDNSVDPLGINKISETQKEIPNPAMAEALNEKYFTATIYEKVIYKNLYNGLDLELSIGKDGVKSTLITSNKKQASVDFNMSVVSSSTHVKKGKSIQLGNTGAQRSIEIISNQSELKINNQNNIQFSADSGSIENLTFDIILK